MLYMLVARHFTRAVRYTIYFLRSRKVDRQYLGVYYLGNKEFYRSVQAVAYPQFWPVSAVVRGFEAPSRPIAIVPLTSVQQLCLLLTFSHLAADLYGLNNGPKLRLPSALYVCMRRR